jgi:hypothetical protein
MSALTVSFVGAIAYTCPWLLPVLEDHLVEQEGEVLPHLFMADVERWAEHEMLNVGQDERLLYLLGLLESEFAKHLDDEVGEVISASFLEHLPRSGDPAEQLRGLVGPRCAERLLVIG